MCSDEYGVVESILASVQWDRWQFMLSAWKLVKQNVAVISHSHRDHWTKNLAEKDVVLVPQEVTVPNELQYLKNVHCVEYSARSGKLGLIELNQRRLAMFLNTRVPKPHAFWWLVNAGSHFRRTRVLFIGDMDANDMPTARSFVAEMFERGLRIHGALLPSFGGVSTHDAKHPAELAVAVESLAYELRDIHGVMVGALPRV